ncbi:MAG: HypC/HybG/HupF family hydrogenase formation chaperone [Deltaproteobacteria bacterium]|nr:HypC/HybG/HupF family hydrogenase formation chaperone [Deltaproteobacteria bacterium]
MCVAIPGRVLALEPDGTAVADFGGTRRSVSLALVEGVGVGDYVIVHAGFALHRVDAEEARQTLELFRAVFDEDAG